MPHRMRLWCSWGKKWEYFSFAKAVDHYGQRRDHSRLDLPRVGTKSSISYALLECGLATSPSTCRDLLLLFPLNFDWFLLEFTNCGGSNTVISEVTSQLIIQHPLDSLVILALGGASHYVRNPTALRAPCWKGHMLVPWKKVSDELSLLSPLPRYPTYEWSPLGLSKPAHLPAEYN